MRPAESNDELRDFSLTISSPVGMFTRLMVPVNGPKLLALPSLRYVFYRLAKWLGIFVVVNSHIHHVVPRDVGLKMMRFGLLFEQSF
jgi:hypothetical protein